MQTNFLLFFYLFSLLLCIPTILIGSLLKPPAKKPILPPTLEQILERARKNPKQIHKNLEEFEKLFLDAQTCDQKLWLETIGEFATSNKLEIKEITNLQEKLKQANPNLANEIALTISVAIKNRK